MIAEVIPYTRTIRGKDCFDYKIPATMDVQVGNLVCINFRSHKIAGLVFGIKESSPYKKVKPILYVYPGKTKWQNQVQRDLLEWFAKYYFISLPHAFRTMQSPVLDKPRKIDTIFCENKEFDGENKLGNFTFRRGEKILLHYNDREQCLLTYQTLIAKLKGNVLIIVPEYIDVDLIKAKIGKCRVAAWDSEPTASQVHRLEMELSQLDSENEPRVVIGTKKMAFLPLQLFDYIILDQEQAKSHKQYHLNPRYHVRNVLNRYYELAVDKPVVIFSSYAPSIETKLKVENKEFTYQDIRCAQKMNKAVQIVNMGDEIKNNNFTWFSDYLIKDLKSSKKAFLFFNRVGNFRLNLCTKCGALIPLSKKKCDDCSSVDLKQVGKGTDALEQEIRAIFQDKQILRIDRNQDVDKTSKQSIMQADIVIGTEKIFSLINMSEFDLIGVVSVDHLLIYPDFRSYERVYQLLTRLLIAQVKTVIQTHSPQNPIIKAAVNGDYEQFSEAELGIRKQLKLPPYSDAFQIINRDRDHIVNKTRAIDGSNLEAGVVIDRL